MQIGPLVKTQQKITKPSRYHNFYTTSFHAKPTFTQHAVTLTQLCHSNIILPNAQSGKHNFVYPAIARAYTTCCHAKAPFT